MTQIVRRLSAAALFLLLTASAALAQTGSIVGAVTDSSNAVLPGATVTLTGERLIGGAQTIATDVNGAYRFDLLPPGRYALRFEMPGFRTVERTDIRVSAAFVATVHARLELGSVEETLTVMGESPTVDVRSTLQQTVMGQDVIEGVPTGRDPWSLAKLIPGVQVATYDVGGTQSIQQSAMSAHGSNTNDVSYNIDGSTVNWPGGGGGATMLYYDQGMFEEVNYMTSAIPAEILVGGLSVNMVTKSSGNPWRGKLLYSFANEDLQSENHLDIARQFDGFLGNPTTKTYDINASGGGAILNDRLWVNGTVRRWIVNKLVNARNPDGSQALDDNTLKNYSGKATAALASGHRLTVSFLWNDKIRGHRRDTPPLFIEDIAAVVQTNPATHTGVRYSGIFNRLVYESSFSFMDGQTNYRYQPGTSADAIRVVDNTLSTARFAAPRDEEQPNERLQFDNTVSYNLSGMGGEHLFKGGVQYARLFWETRYTVQGDHWLEYSNSVPTQVRQWNTPTNPKNLANVIGFFIQDSWTMRNLTLNLGGRFDHYTGILPDQSAPGGPFIEARSLSRQEVISQGIGVWRAGAAYDLFGTGQTAFKASYSRYATQVGIDRVTSVNPFSAGSRTCPWNDANSDGRFQANEITGPCSAFSGGISTFYADDGVDWPYSDEVTAGFEHQLGRDTRVGVMYYYRTNREQLGVRNVLVPASQYTPFTVSVPGSPLGVSTVTVHNLNPALAATQLNIRDNDPALDTDYHGVEFTAAKRFTHNWQMVAGLTLGKNEGGLNTPGGSGQAANNNLNDPNFRIFDRGIIGNDSKVAFRLSGSYRFPWDITLSGSFIANSGYPFVSTYTVTRAIAAQQGVTMTQASVAVPLSRRGDEQLPTVRMVDLRLAKTFRFGERRFSPQLDIYNLGNASTVVSTTTGIGASYLRPGEILAPRIIRLGFMIDF